jgi:predicted amidohydrolase
MDIPIVATAQQQMRLFESPDDYRRELARFMQIAQAKGATLVVFPALSGILAVSPLLEGFRVRLLRRAGSNRRNTSALDRARRALAGGTAEMLKANFHRPYRDLLAAEPQAAEEAYLNAFSSVAQTYAMTVVAGSAYLPGEDGVIRHTSIAFGPDGSPLGRQDKVFLTPEEEAWAQPGHGWNVITTPAGRLGLVFETEVGYPEIGRWLSQQDIDLMVVLACTTEEASVAATRLAAVARAQENLRHVVTSFPVGPDYLSPDQTGVRMLLGRSGIYAPLAQTPRFSGVLVEMGALTTEGLLTGELDGANLLELREDTTHQLGWMMPLLQVSDAVFASSDETQSPPAESALDMDENGVILDEDQDPEEDSPS